MMMKTELLQVGMGPRVWEGGGRENRSRGLNKRRTKVYGGNRSNIHNSCKYYIYEYERVKLKKIVPRFYKVC